MAFENTITELDMDVKSRQLVQGLREAGQEYEPDLDVEGMSDSILSRIFGLFSRSR